MAAKVLLALGVLLLASGIILPQQGVQYIHDEKSKSNSCAYVWAHVGAWRDLRTGYVCEFDHDWSDSCFCPPCQPSYSSGHKCGYSGWYGYTTTCEAYNLQSPYWSWICVTASIRG